MIANDLPTLKRIDALLAPEAAPTAIFAALDDANWQVQQAALQAVETRALREAVQHVAGLLDRQDRLDLYGAPEAWTLDPAPDAATREAWRCRFRVKQAACLALGAIGHRHGGDAVGRDVIRRLAAYACSTGEDFCVRAAACRALGRMRAAAATEALRTAARDQEWCTATEAAKALAVITDAIPHTKGPPT